MANVGSFPGAPSLSAHRLGRAGTRGRVVLIVLNFVLAVGAIAGGLLLAVYPHGGGPMQFDLAYLEGSPFASFLLPGLFLASVGLGALSAGTMHWREDALAPYLSFAVGFLLLVFELVELAIIPFSVLQPLYVLVGLALMVLAVRSERDRDAALATLRRLARLGGYRLALVAVILLIALYAIVVRPWFINWGATAEEQQMSLPGDDLRPDATWRVTRAIIIQAPAGDVWAWLIQHGQDRAGFYSYTWLENLTGADIHNVDELRPEWQQRSIGEPIPMARPYFGTRSETTVLRVRVADPGRALVTTSETGDVAIRAIVPIDEQSTRLIFRDLEGEGSAGPLHQAWRWLAWEPMHFVMQHGMLAGLKLRAEGQLHQPASLYYAARLGWVAAGAAVLALMVADRRRVVWLALPILATIPALALAGDLDAALAGFLAVGVATYGTIRWGWRWLPYLALLTGVVLLGLLITADAYLAFGLLFLVLIGALVCTFALLRPDRTKAAWQTA